jgi:hypothetical protein
LARRFGLGPDPSNETELIDSDILRDELTDFTVRFTQVVYNKNLNQV